MEKNQLKYCSSPYLQQHANNPVHWHPWHQEALEKAKKENKPILLSIGYSACHWCHVMAHESFEDEETAQLMNENFINIKVDREERPDLDKIYQLSHQILNQQGGGWPLTVFLQPENHLPFFSGTYFPKQKKYGLPSFQTVLMTIAELYKNQPKEIHEQSVQLKNIFNKLTFPQSTTEGLLSEEPIELAIDQLEEDFDEVNGGFGTAPKFPSPTNLQRLLRRYKDSPRDKKAAQMLRKTLDAMAMGGIYDQIGGGFFRYCVDDHWEVPHFEKMLYDNGSLLALYSQASVLLKNPYYKQIAIDTANWAIKKMQSPQGGFYTSLDADSLGIEGKFYLWDPKEIEGILTNEEYQLVKEIYNLQQSPNFKQQWHLYQIIPIASLSKENLEILENAKQRLLKARRERIAPHKDEKILTSWNGLMIRGLAIAGFVLQEQRFIDAAEKALLFIQHNMHTEQGLYACYKSDHAYNLAYLDDYAFLLDATLFQLQAKFSASLLNFAMTLANECIEKFYDKEHGGFFFTAHSHEHLIYRPKIYSDEALPSGNGIMAFALNRLGHLLGNLKYISIAENTIQSAWQDIETTPVTHQTLLHALEEILQPVELVFIVYKNEIDINRWKKKLIDNYHTHRISFLIPISEANKIDVLGKFKSADKDIVAYRCKDQKCSLPITDLTYLFNS